MSALNNVILTPIYPANSPLTLALNGDTTYLPATGGTGGWQIVDRPRLVAATQWYDRAPMELDIPFLIDSLTIYGEDGFSIELFCMILDGWQDKTLGTLQPPVLSISGPVPSEALKRFWVVYNLEYDEAVRDAQAGFRVVQKGTLKLYEYSSPSSFIYGTVSPAQQFNSAISAASGTQSFTLYTVGPADTLSSIAAKYLGSYTRWPAIAALNNIRDPRSIVAGQVLKLPLS